MAKFDRYLLSQLLLLFGFFSIVLVSVYWINRAISLFDQLIADGQTAFVFLEFTLLALPYVIMIVLPISAFVSTIYVINRLTSDSEIVVMQTSGASTLRIGRGVFLFGVIVALLVGILAHILVPAARSELAGRSAEVSRDISARFLKEGQFVHPTKGITVYVRRITERGIMEELFLEDRRNPASVVTYMAEQALLVRQETGPRLVMLNGLAQTLQAETRRLNTIAFDEFAYDIGALISTGSVRQRDLRELPTFVLLNPSPAALAGTAGNRADFLFAGHDRFARSLMAIIVPMLGFAALMLGGFSRFGIWQQVLIAVVLIILVQMVANASEEIARQDESLVLMAYLAPAIGFVITALLIVAGRLGPLRRRIKRVRA